MGLQIRVIAEKSIPNPRKSSIGGLKLTLVSGIYPRPAMQSHNILSGNGAVMC